MRRRKAKFDIYRDGKVHVCARMCATCIYRPDGLLTVEPRTNIVRRAVAHQTAVVCHSTLDEPSQAVCRGFFERDATLPLQLAESIGCIEWQEPPRKVNK